MTLEQLMSPKVTEWIDKYNRRLNEGYEHSDEKLFEEFENWFIQNESEINESIRKEHVLNESGVFDFFDEDDEKPEEDVVDDEIPEETEPSEDSTSEETSSEEVEKPSPKGKHKVDNSSNSKRNVFKVVNTLYDKITKEGRNMDKITYLKFLDTSEVSDMTALLAFTNLPNADLSSWDTGYVSNMEGMFYKSTFNNDSICEWDVENCAKFKNMFLGSKFNQSLSKWKPKMITAKEPVYDEETGERKGWEEVRKRASLPFVGAYEDEEKEMDSAYWDEKFKDGIEETKKSKFTHVLDFDTFMLNEGLWDKTKKFGKKVIDKVKNLFKTFAVKLNKYFVSVVDEKGEPIPAINPYTTLNYLSGADIDGVKAYTHVSSPLLNDNVKSDAELDESTEYYQNISKDDIEYKNYQTFCQMINESIQAGEIEGELINEERVGFSHESGGVMGISDINSSELTQYITDQMMSTPFTSGKHAMKPILIWGAPGIGKSTIPNSIIKAYNKGKESKYKKSLLVVECGDLTPDGISLPMPTRETYKEYMELRPGVQKLAQDLKLSDEYLSNSIIVRSDDAPKTWLPCYQKHPDPKVTEIRKAIANGNLNEYYDDDNNYVLEETCDGGILMFDEFFRADPSIFKILMQLLLNRSYSNGKFILGDKWAIIACSNRPNDDEEVGRAFDSGNVSGALKTRFSSQFNFVPNFAEWRKWAESEGRFDEDTLLFLVSEKDSKGEYINWHNIDPDDTSSVVYPTPRSWSELINRLNEIVRVRGYKSIKDIPDEQFMQIASGAIGEKTAKKYVDWLKNRNEKLNIKSIFEDADYKVPEPIPSAAEMTELIYNYVESHYTPEHLPKEEELINMFNTLNGLYKRSKDNYVKELHHRIIHLLVKSKEQATQLKNYYKMCVDRYEINK